MKKKLLKEKEPHSEGYAERFESQESAPGAQEPERYETVRSLEIEIEQCGETEKERVPYLCRQVVSELGYFGIAGLGKDIEDVEVRPERGRQKARGNDAQERPRGAGALILGYESLIG